MSQLLASNFEGGVTLASLGYEDPGSAYEIQLDARLGGSYCVAQSGALAQAVFVKGKSPLFPGGTTLGSASREFHASACFDHSWTPWETGIQGNAIVLGRLSPNSSYNTIFTLEHGWSDSDTGYVRLRQNAGLGGAIVATVDSAFARDTPVTLAIEGEVSTVTGGDEEGGGTAASDGWMRVYVNGVLVIEYLDQQVGHYIDNQGPPEFWDSWANVSDPVTYINVNALGRVDNLCVRDDLLDCDLGACGSGNSAGYQIENSIPCCADDGPGGTGGGGGGDTGTNPDPVGTLPPWIASCTGGGVVEELADLSDGESWL